MAQKKMKWASAAAMALFVLFCLFVTAFIGPHILRLGDEPELFRQWVESYGIYGKILFVLLVVLQVVVALIPGEPLELAAGYAFGALEGTVLAMIGIMIGSILVFLAVRRFGRKLLEVFFADRDIRRLQFLKDPQKVKVLTFILMTIPGTPKDLLSYFAGLTPLTLPQWLLIVSVSRIPSLVTSTVSGAAAGEENYLLAGAVFVGTLLVSAVGVWYYKRICDESKSC